MKKLILLPLLLLSFAHAEIINCVFVGNLNGDTLLCRVDDPTIDPDQQPNVVMVKLSQIAAPKKGQAYEKEATQALKEFSDRAIGQAFTIKVNKKEASTIWGTVFDWYSELTVPSAGNCLRSRYLSEEEISQKDNTCGPWPMIIVDINKEMIKQGYAWYDPSMGKNLTYQQAQEEAKQAKRGLWAVPNPIVPWE
ncbi:thermonuclease family protein [Neisseria sp. Ec49-e6-T10]|uniref:thermonuclease family protein n=1 Tax=Neisseria sp. Ec49-e6-T10 TaxID=3140744 RepID=UPI003EBBCC04